MSKSHTLLRTLTLALLALPLGSCAPTEPAPLTDRIDRALERALSFLVAQQDPDGAWRSKTYGALKDGFSLTPSVLKALAYTEDPAFVEARDRGATWLTAKVTAEGQVDDAPYGLAYPVYGASLAVMALTRLEITGEQRDAWLRLLRSHQLTEDRGWSPGDLAYGGWGYSREPLRKPPSGSPVRLEPYDADLSSTLFALGALVAAGASAEDPAIVAARRFVLRCQNHPREGEDPEPRFDDGGFFFTPTNTLQNKAGEAGRDRSSCPRYRSYGAMTADGLRALLRCGLTPDHPRVRAARAWLEEHWSVAAPPGDFELTRESEREASYYYWCWSSAHALRALAQSTLTREGREIPWPRLLAEELLTRQLPDGSWKNPRSNVMEDDPLVATPFATAALALCRAFL